MVTVNSASFFDTVYEGLRPAWARNIVFVNLQVDPTWQTNNVYYLECEIGIDNVFPITNPPTYTKILRQSPDENGVVQFELQQVFRDYVLMEVAVPDLNATQISYHHHVNFSVAIREVSDAGTEHQNLERMNGSLLENQYWIVNAIDAGLDREHFSYEQQHTWLLGALEDNGSKFLTSTEDPKSSHTQAQEFLYWYGNRPNRDDCQVFLKLYYDDNTEEDTVLFDYVQSGGAIACIPTRYELIKQKSTEPTKNIVMWGVFVGRAVEGITYRLSEFFRYELPDQVQRKAKHLLYKNSLGVYDTLVCAGDWEEMLESDAQTASRRDLQDYAISDAQRIMLEIEGKRSGTVNTVYLNHLQIHVKQDIIRSESVLLQDTFAFIPIILDKPKMLYDIKNNGLLGLSLSYQMAHNVNLYTNPIFRPILAEVPSPPTLPKAIFKNYGSEGGMMKVEWESNVEYIAPNSEQGFEIEFGVHVSVTRSIVDVATLQPDANLVNPAYGNYKFAFARMVQATFDSIVEEGSVVAGVPDETVRMIAGGNVVVKRARQHTFVMPNTSYIVECEFRDIELSYDIDPENPICTNNTAVGVSVERLVDRLGNIPPIIQATPTLRPIRSAANQIKFEDYQTMALDGFDAPSTSAGTGGNTNVVQLFMILSIDNDPTPLSTREVGRLDTPTGWAGWLVLYGVNGGTSGYYKADSVGVSPTSGVFNITTDIYTTNWRSDNTKNREKILLYAPSSDTSKGSVAGYQQGVYKWDNTTVSFAARTRLRLNTGRYTSNQYVPSGRLDTSYYRILQFADILTAAETLIVRNKLETHYSL